MSLKDTAQAAEYLGRIISPSTLAKLRVTGGGPKFVKVGVRVFYDLKDLDEWLLARPRHSSTSELSLPPTSRPRGRPRTALAATAAEGDT